LSTLKSQKNYIQWTQIMPLDCYHST